MQNLPDEKQRGCLVQYGHGSERMVKGRPVDVLYGRLAPDGGSSFFDRLYLQISWVRPLRDASAPPKSHFKRLGSLKKQPSRGGNRILELEKSRKGDRIVLGIDTDGGSCECS